MINSNEEKKGDKNLHWSYQTNCMDSIGKFFLSFSYCYLSFLVNVCSKKNKNDDFLLFTIYVSRFKIKPTTETKPIQIHPKRVTTKGSDMVCLCSLVHN